MVHPVLTNGHVLHWEKTRISFTLISEGWRSDRRHKIVQIFEFRENVFNGEVKSKWMDSILKKLVGKRSFISKTLKRDVH